MCETYTQVFYDSYMNNHILFLQISRTVGTDTSRLKVVIGTQYVCQHYYALYVASSPTTHSLIPRPSITANTVESLVKLLHRMMSGGRLEVWLIGLCMH